MKYWRRTTHYFALLALLIATPSFGQSIEQSTDRFTGVVTREVKFERVFKGVHQSGPRNVQMNLTLSHESKTGFVSMLFTIIGLPADGPQQLRVLADGRPVTLPEPPILVAGSRVAALELGLFTASRGVLFKGPEYTRLIEATTLEARCFGLEWQFSSADLETLRALIPPAGDQP